MLASSPLILCVYVYFSQGFTHTLSFLFSIFTSESWIKTQFHAVNFIFWDLAPIHVTSLDVGVSPVSFVTRWPSHPPEWCPLIVAGCTVGALWTFSHTEATWEVRRARTLWFSPERLRHRDFCRSRGHLLATCSGSIQ